MKPPLIKIPEADLTCTASSPEFADMEEELYIILALLKCEFISIVSGNC